MKKRLLLIEDEVITGTVYKFHFTSAGYEVKIADDGERGLKAVTQFKPDIVVLDLMLPKFSGVEVIKSIRSRPETKSLPIVVFTNALDRTQVSEAMNAGANKCLIKAETNSEQLLDALKEILATESLRAKAAPTAAATPKPEPSDPRAEFFKTTRQDLSHLRRMSQDLLTEARVNDRPAILRSMLGAVCALTTKAGLGEVSTFAEMSSALELLLRELHENPARISDSTLRTVNQSIAFLAELFTHLSSKPLSQSSATKVLVVDDEVVSRRAIAQALELTRLKPTVLDDPIAAYELLTRECFDLIISDIDMPKMNGFELCEKLRALPGLKETPVMLVTVMTDFNSRVRSAQSGASDFIAKPFVLIELATKALIWLLRRRLNYSQPSAQSFVPKVRG